MSESVWVFGYGSLASPASVARTLGRPVPTDRGWRVGHLEGYGRRGNSGSKRLRGNWELGDASVAAGVVVSLGLVRADETCNGALVRVSQTELHLLDRRESDYERTDVTDRIPEYTAVRALSNTGMSLYTRATLLIDGEATFDSILDGVSQATTRPARMTITSSLSG